MKECTDVGFSALPGGPFKLCNLRRIKQKRRHNETVEGNNATTFVGRITKMYHSGYIYFFVELKMHVVYGAVQK